MEEVFHCILRTERPFRAFIRDIIKVYARYLNELVTNFIQFLKTPKFLNFDHKLTQGLSPRGGKVASFSLTESFGVPDFENSEKPTLNNKLAQLLENR